MPSGNTKMAIKVNGTTVVHNSLKGDYQSMNVGSYTTTNRPVSEVGDLIYNSSEQKITSLEWHSGNNGY